MAYLVEHRPARHQFRHPRRASPSGVCVVHTAENIPTIANPDDSAERVAAFIRVRTDAAGSYHDVADSDSGVHLVPWDAEAFGDGTGSNPHAYHVSAACRAARWRHKPDWWVRGTVEQMATRSALYARWLRARSGIMIPARRITRAESERRIPGFISHAERDPTRRTDPGAWFPWDLFLARFDALARAVGDWPSTPEDDMPDRQLYVVRVTEREREKYVTDWYTKVPLGGGSREIERERAHVAILRQNQLIAPNRGLDGNGHSIPVAAAFLDEIPLAAR